MPADMLGFRNTNSFTLDNYFCPKESFTNLPGMANTGVLLFVGLFFFVQIQVYINMSLIIN